MINKKIYIRADGNDQIGLGHLVRCIALAQMLKTDFDIFFTCKEIPESSMHEIIELGFSLIIIKKEGEFLSCLKGDEIVILDHYSLDSNYQKRVKEKGCKLVCIDDLHDKTFFADLIINHAPNIKPSDYQAQVYTQFALGLDYVLLRPAFLKKAREVINNEIIQTVLICFGGSDSKNITQTVVEILKNDSRFKNIIVITGSAYNYSDQLKQIVNTAPGISLYHAIDSEMMVDLMSKAQLAIVPASGILQEALTVGCKVVSGMYVDNQKYIFENYKALNAFESAEDFSRENLLSALNNVFKNKSRVKKLIDGKSGDRLLKVFNQLVKEDDIIIRNAAEQDIAKTFEWASNSEIRKFSFNNSIIEYDEHKKWFTHKLNDKNCFYFLGQLNNESFGSIRFDVDGREAKISYLVDPKYQKNGLGTILLKKGLDIFLKQLNTNVLSVWGEVFNENLASVKAFEKLGYSMEFNFLSNFVKFKKVLVKEIS